MDERINKGSGLFYQNGQESKMFAIMFVASVAFHLFFFGFAIYARGIFPEPEHAIDPATVLAVNISAAPMREEPEFPEIVEAETTEITETEIVETPEVTETVIPEPEVSDPVIIKTPEKEPEKIEKPKKKEEKKEKPKPVHKRSLKEKTKKKNIKTITPEAHRLKKAIAKIKDDLEKGKSQYKTVPYGGSGTGGNGGIAKRIDIYKVEVANEIRQNWSFSEQLAGSKSNLVVIFTVRVMPDGKISKAEILESSDNGYFDESALNAVKKASPVAPHPAGVDLKYLEFSIRGRSSEFM